MPTLQTTYSANFGDNTMPIAGADPTATIGTDFIFDAFTAAGYPNGALPTNGAALTGLVNLARNLAPVIPYTSTQVRAATLRNPAKPPTFDSAKGWAFNPSTTEPFAITLSGVANNRVCEPVLEGFKEFTLIMWFRMFAAPATQTGIVFLGQAGGGSNSNGGVAVFSGTQPTEVINSTAISNPAIGQLIQISTNYKFDTVAGTSSVRIYADGNFVAATPGRAPTAYASNNPNAAAFIGGGLGFEPAMNGSICRVMREFNGLTGQTADAVVARDYVLNFARLTAGV